MLCVAVVAPAAAAGCGTLGPQPIISSFSAGATEVELGDSLRFTVQGSTNPEETENDFADFTGTVDVLLNGESQGERAIEESFSESYTISFDEAGKVTVKATLTGADGTVVESEELTVTVTEPVDPSEGSKSDPVELAFGGSARASAVGADKSSYYKFTISSAKTDSKVELDSSGSLDVLPYLYSNDDWDFANSIKAYPSGLHPYEDGVLDVGYLGAGTYYLEVENQSSLYNYTFKLSVY